MAIFCAAIPVGSALGYVVGGAVNALLGWRWAFYLVAPPGLLLGTLCFFQRDPREPAALPRQNGQAQVSRRLPCRVPHALVCLQLPGANRDDLRARRARLLDAGLFAYSGISPHSSIIDLRRHHRRRRTRLHAARRCRRRSAAETFSRLLLSGLRRRHAVAFPLFLGVLYTPFPLAWVLHVWRGLLCFSQHRPIEYGARQCRACPSVRATAFAVNIFVIHLFGDAAAFPPIGSIGGHTNMHIAFLVVSGRCSSPE